MRVDALDQKELLELDPAGGLIHFAGQRALIIDAVAQGLLRKELIDTLGVRVAQGILSRFGYVHGRRMAEAMRTQFKWDSDDDWRKAGARIYALQGLFMLEPGSTASFESEGGTWRVSYEAEQHILHLGLADYPVCWTLSGLVSGYLSFATGGEVYALEDRCMGKGDTACHVTPGVRAAASASSGEASSFTATIVTSWPSARAASSTRNGNRPLPAMRPRRIEEIRNAEWNAELTTSSQFGLRT